MCFGVDAQQKIALRENAVIPKMSCVGELATEHTAGLIHDRSLSTPSGVT